MKAPKHKPASPKQAAARKEAGRAYAAAGRTAQAAKRKANLAAGKPTRSKRQQQASAKWAAAGRAAQARKREKLPPLPKHPRAIQGIVLPGHHPGGSGAAVPPAGKGGKGKKGPPPPVSGIVLPGQHPGGSGASAPPGKKGKKPRLVLPGQHVGGFGPAVSAKRRKAALKGAKTRAANKKKRGLSPLFGNDAAPVCTAAAIAAHLWLSTGIYIGDAETAELQEQSGGVIGDALELIGSRGLGGARLAAYWPLADGPVLAGAITGLRWPQGRHSVVALSGDTCLSWGIQMPLSGVVEEQWWLEWDASPGADSRQ